MGLFRMNSMNDEDDRLKCTHVHGCTLKLSQDWTACGFSVISFPPILSFPSPHNIVVPARMKVYTSVNVFLDQ